MLHILIVEDEALVARRLRRLLENLLEKVSTQILALSGFDVAREYLQNHDIDLLFLDLNLNGKDGFGLLIEAVAGPFETVVVSANIDRALEAFDLGVLDFVAKPFGEVRLQQALDRFHQRPRDHPAQVLAIRSGGHIEMVPVAEVVAIHGADNYAEIETRQGRRLLHDKRLDHLEKVMPDRFVRIHRSHIVDWQEVMSLVVHRGSRYEVVLKTGTKLPVSRQRVPDLRKRVLS